MLVTVAAVALVALLPVGAPESANASIEVRLETNDPDSEATRVQLLRLLDAYDLSKWIITREVLIDRRVIPHSHPVLTLSTRHLKDDELLLATFLHEQLHWHVGLRPENREEAVKDLKQLFTAVPVGYPDGARDEYSTYLHLIVCYLEYQAVREVLGELRALWVIEFWAQDHYRWVYQQILERGKEIGKIVEKHQLRP